MSAGAVAVVVGEGVAVVVGEGVAVVVGEGVAVVVGVVVGVVVAGAVAVAVAAELESIRTLNTGGVTFERAQVNAQMFPSFVRPGA